MFAVVFNAGLIEPMVRVAAMSDADFEPLRRLYDVNVLSVIKLASELIPLMHRSIARLPLLEPKFIFVSSGAAVSATPAWTGYCSSKAALNMISKTISHEEPSITCISLSPGPVATDMQQTIRQKGAEHMRQGDHAKFCRLHEEGKLVTTEQAAEFISALVAHAPRSLSGEFVRIDDERVRVVVDTYRRALVSSKQSLSTQTTE